MNNYDTTIPFEKYTYSVVEAAADLHMHCRGSSGPTEAVAAYISSWLKWRTSQDIWNASKVDSATEMVDHCILLFVKAVLLEYEGKNR